MVRNSSKSSLEVEERDETSGLIRPYGSGQNHLKPMSPFLLSQTQLDPNRRGNSFEMPQVDPSEFFGIGLQRITVSSFGIIFGGEDINCLAGMR